MLYLTHYLAALFLCFLIQIQYFADVVKLPSAIFQLIGKSVVCGVFAKRYIISATGSSSSVGINFESQYSSLISILGFRHFRMLVSLCRRSGAIDKNACLYFARRRYFHVGDEHRK